MAEYIDRILLGEAVSHGMVHYEDIMSMPTADVVEQKVLDQVYWERDTALHQLAEIGKGLGEKMDDVVKRSDILSFSPICIGCDGKTEDGKRTDLCDYETTYERCLAQSGKLADIAEAYFSGELVERKHGKWTDISVYGIEDTSITDVQSAICSVCHKYHTTPYMYYFDNFNFCPNCGADMREEESE